MYFKAKTTQPSIFFSLKYIVSEFTKLNLILKYKPDIKNKLSAFENEISNDY